jgi:putative ABC transport system permease protein
MLTNYLLTAFRNLQRNKSYAFINTLGLAVGIAACLLLFLVVQFETSFDNFHKKKAAIYRVGTELHSQDGITYTDGSPLPVGPALRIDFPQIKEVASIFKNYGGQITIDNGTAPAKKLREDNFYYAEPEFFAMFDFGWLQGDANSVLAQPNSIVLTQSTAEKYFGNWRSAMGRTVKHNNATLYTVTGILKNIPPNSDFPLAAVVPYSSLKETYLKNNFQDWVSTFSGACTFVVLPPELPVAKFNAELKSFAKRHKPAAYAADAPFAQPLSEIHYDGRFGNYPDRIFSHSLINALSLIGLFLIVIACVNFINLSTAQAVNRSKEVGVRKVLGSSRRQLAFQFLGETALLTIFAVIMSLIIARLFLPFLNQLLELQLTISLANPVLIGFLGLLTILVTFLSGTYPALILSGFNPITALKSRISVAKAGGLSLRRVLVILQFSIAQALVIGMLIVVSQMNYFRHATLGFNKTAIVNVDIPFDSVSRSRVDHLRNSLLENPAIKDVSLSFASPSSDNGWNTDLKFDHSTKKTEFGADLKWADTSYFRLYGLRFIAGRPYYHSDTIREFVVNETFLQKLGIRHPQDAIGKEINLWDQTKANIVGVVKDFNVRSLQRPITPVIMSTWKALYQTINIQITSGSEQAALPFIQQQWTRAFPDYVYHYQFLDDTIAGFYKHEAQLSQLYKIFAAIALFISCLGLYGLVAFMAVQRTREMGIRKVLGASARNIIYLLSKEFTVLIIIAFALAAPIAYYIMHKWLMNYHYRITPGLTIFALAIGGSIIIAWITVGHRAIRAALANPIQSLRSE